MDYQEPRCKDCTHLARDIQFEEWDCEHPGRPEGKSTVQPRDPAAPEWCPLRSQRGAEASRRALLEDFMGFLADAGSALHEAEKAAERAEPLATGLWVTKKRVVRLHEELLEIRKGLARTYELEV